MDFEARPASCVPSSFIVGVWSYIQPTQTPEAPVYLLNDILDLDVDRQHHSKFRRPLASGQLPIAVALGLIIALLALAFTLSVALSLKFAIVLTFYYIVTLSYSFALKQMAVIDALVLAGLYTLRIVGGFVGTEIVPSFWLVAFSLFMFLSLALLKRYSELLAKRKTGASGIAGRGYLVSDAELLSTLGIGSGLVACLIVALYVHSEGVALLYRHPEMLLGIIPLLIFWVARAWMIAHRGEMNDDPIVFAIRDRASLIVIAVIGLIGALASI